MLNLYSHGNAHARTIRGMEGPLIEIQILLKENERMKPLGRMIREASSDLRKRYKSYEVPLRLVRYKRDRETITLAYDIDGDFNKK